MVRLLVSVRATCVLSAEFRCRILHKRSPVSRPRRLQPWQGPRHRTLYGVASSRVTVGSGSGQIRLTPGSVSGQKRVKGGRSYA